MQFSGGSSAAGFLPAVIRSSAPLLSGWLQSVAQIFKNVQCAACLVPELQKKVLFFLQKVC